jgi:hypothetical protein
VDSPSEKGDGDGFDGLKPSFLSRKVIKLNPRI